MSFKRINNITGWIVFLIASAVYILTMEKNGSLWDCGEFASCAYKLQIPHPPGAPLFVLIGRLFMAPFGSATAATGVNLMSALASAFTILFLFWTITHFARKMVMKNEGELSQNNIFGIMAAGVVGALAYTFSDSFWFSAVEGEVYALSSFFTAIVFWCILKWEQEVTEEQAVGINGHFTRADRWIILTFFLMGLSIGVHLLNLLTIPAMVVVYYFKRYKVTTWGTFWAFIIGCIITGVVQKAVIQWSMSGAGLFDRWFVNGFGTPFFSGFAFFWIFLAALIYFGLRIAKKNNYNFLRLGLWSFAFMLIGFASYFTTLIRSNANPSVDMFNVDNPVSLVGYLNREQYGDWPILYGQDFTANFDTKVTPIYIKSGKRYELNGQKVRYEYAPEDMHLFPRMWDNSNDQGHADYYADWAGIGKDERGRYDGKPSVGDNISFMMGYQFNWMYWRYFLWNFAGKQNDIQGIHPSNVRDGNWKTGIGFYDKMRLGDQNMLPDTARNNKANNKLFALPFILGLLGMAYQYTKDRRDFLVTFLLFFFTGAAIVLYLNQAGNQPRERDYAYVGSFYAFAIWIGLGVFLVRDAIASLTKNLKTATYISATVSFLAVPLLMGMVEWDDHDRSNKLMAPDLATNYLESCEQNAVLISFGDNDTYPLWYAQEVLGVRPDIRVVNASLLGTDWYINQLRYKVNKSAPIDLVWTPDQIEGSRRDFIYNTQLSGVDENQPMSLLSLLKDYAGSDAPNKSRTTEDGTLVNVYPTRKVFIPVDQNVVRSNGTVNPKDSVLNAVSFELPTKAGLGKNETAILNIIAANNWKRPIYFTSPYDELGFGAYLRQDGLTYRLVPVVNHAVNEDWVVDKMLNKFRYGNADKQGVYFDEENRRHLNSIRIAFAQAASNLAQNGRKEDAKKLLEKCDKGMLEENMPYGMISRGQFHNRVSSQFLLAAYLAEDKTLAEKIHNKLKKDMEQQMAYYNSLPDNKRDGLAYEEKQNQMLYQNLLAMEQQLKNPQVAQPNPEQGGQIKTGPAPKAGGTP